MQNEWKNIPDRIVIYYYIIDVIRQLIGEINNFKQPLLFMPEMYKHLERNKQYEETIQKIKKINPEKVDILGDIFGEQDSLEKFVFLNRAKSLLKENKEHIKNLTLL